MFLPVGYDTQCIIEFIQDNATSRGDWNSLRVAHIPTFQVFTINIPIFTTCWLAIERNMYSWVIQGNETSRGDCSSLREALVPMFRVFTVNIPKFTSCCLWIGVCIVKFIEENGTSRGDWSSVREAHVTTFRMFTVNIPMFTTCCSWLWHQSLLLVPSWLSWTMISFPASLYIISVIYNPW